MDRAGNILKNIFLKVDSAAGKKYLPLFQQFNTLLGNEARKHAALRDIRHNTLHIEVDHPGWLQTVLLRKKAVLNLINTRYPGLEITNIKVTVVKKLIPVKPHFPRERAVSSDEKPSPWENDASFLASLEENDLKKALKKLYDTRSRRKWNGPNTG